MVVAQLVEHKVVVLGVAGSSPVDHPDILDAMFSALAYAESGDSSTTNLIIVLGGAFVIALVAAMAFVLIVISRSRGHRRAEVIAVAAVFWALIAAGSLLYAGVTQINWSKEHQMRLETGYLDPADTDDAPRLPLGTWTGLGVVYVAMLGWSRSQKQATPRES